MTKSKEKTELILKEETRPEHYFGEMERFFDRFFRRPFSVTAPAAGLGDFFGDYPRLGEISPTVDIFEEGHDLVLKAELPGIKKEDLTVTVTENSITISGEKKREEKIEKKDYHWIESSHGSFSRSFRLPGNVNADEADASFKEGILEIRVPKTREAGEKKISVK